MLLFFFLLLICFFFLSFYIYLFTYLFLSLINKWKKTIHLLLLLVNIKCENTFEFLDGRNTVAICDFTFTKWCQTTHIRKRLNGSQSKCCKTFLCGDIAMGGINCHLHTVTVPTETKELTANLLFCFHTVLALTEVFAFACHLSKFINLR